MDRSSWARAILIAVCGAAAMIPLGLSTRPSPPKAAPAEAKAPETFDVAAIDAWIAKKVEALGLVGVSVAIVRDGNVVLAKGYGKASLEPSAPVTTDTAFAIGSVSKELTCAAAWMLVDDGKLSMSEPVAKYYPALTRAADITLDDLGAHLSGYPDYYPLDFLDARMRKPIEHDQLIADYAGKPLDFEPRTRWSYSNTGFIVLGRVVEKVSGQPLGAFFQKRIFEPAEMTHASLDPADGTAGLARGYTAFALGDPEPAERDRPGWLFGAGGVYASATDLAKWDLALMDGKLLKPASQQRMTTTRALTNHRATDYGCGLAIGDRAGEIVLSHGGEVSGFLAQNAMIPRTRSAVVVLSNRDDVSPVPIHEGILKLLLEDRNPKPVVRGVPAADAARELVRMLQTGAIDRTTLGADYDAYLTDDRARGARKRLEGLGPPKSVDVERIAERGGMEVAVLRITFESKSLRGLMYRTPDGKIQELFFAKM